jgi:putative transposase
MADPTDTSPFAAAVDVLPPVLLAVSDNGPQMTSCVVRHEYNNVRLHAGIGYVTPADEHEGRGEKIRAARKRGLRHARWARIAYHRIQQAKANRRSPTDVD